jgi:hypothetical protein
MYTPSDPALVGTRPETSEEQARQDRITNAHGRARAAIGQNLPDSLLTLVETSINGFDSREKAELIPSATFETDRDALYCRCGQMLAQHDDPTVACFARRRREEHAANASQRASVLMDAQDKKRD